MGLLVKVCMCLSHLKQLAYCKEINYMLLCHIYFLNPEAHFLLWGGVAIGLGVRVFKGGL